MKLIKAMATVAGMTGLSRIAGFTRDILTATILGAGPIADAFFVALKLPNLFRRVTAEGAFSVSFVPLYSETLEKEGEEAAGQFAGQTFVVMLWGLLAFTILALFAMPWIIHVIAPGFEDDPVRYSMALELSRVTFPYLLLMSLTALMGGMLNAHDRFAPFAAAPILFNLSLIGFLLLSNIFFETPGHAMAWGVIVAGILQLGLLFTCIRKAKIPLIIILGKKNDKIKKLFKLMGPGIIGAGVVQINLFVDLIIASFLDTGSISYLYYADRLNQLPLGIVGIAIGTALLPMLSKALAAEKKEEAHSLFNRSIEACLLLALPASVGLFVISFPIVVTLFQHGAFDFEAAKMTTAVLTGYAIGMPAYIMVKVYSAAYWARQDTVTPVKISIASTLFNTALSLWLVFYAGAGIVGIAVATSLAGWLQLVALAYGLRRFEEIHFDERLKKNGLKIIAACILMAVALYAVKPQLMSLFMASALLPQILGLITLLISGVLVYGGILLLTKAVTFNELKATVKRNG